ncbi:hypothetical protein [Bradyrhizobium prioriisuperbiae]|uniref:hypothetical protein n=1 Tax=Bradyrhizobium prioriisuperbiae TaxID=2854389 RepID=UPI0028E6844B|nr:hypothetical protein [Bradyrhizobium prioritasuperba]
MSQTSEWLVPERAGVCADTGALRVWEAPALRVLTLRAWMKSAATSRTASADATASPPMPGPLSMNKDGSTFDLRMSHRDMGKGGNNADGMQHNHN